jgi:hypothetical protein
MKGEKRNGFAPGLVALMFLASLVGCAGNASHPLGPVEEGAYLEEIILLERNLSTPVLSGDGPYEVSFTVTPEEGGSGELDFVSFEVEPKSVKQDVVVTISIEDPGYYLIELSSPNGGKIRGGRLTFHIEAVDLEGIDTESIGVYVETHRGWQHLPAVWSPDGSDMTVPMNKLSRYALSRE